MVYMQCNDTFADQRVIGMSCACHMSLDYVGENGFWAACGLGH